ncbi:lipase 3-like [Pararge aegeria]|uniref:lipase 3-like n=1 Tax=Pararge aegeria TaxID=116150 RepID=UPI0019D17054|nr:lipase 3-like [Pararge aegeria]
MITFILIIFYVLHSTYTIPAKWPHKFISFEPPETRPIKRPLGYIEDTYLNFTQLATKYGYPSEQHSVITEDGYVLTVFRILPKCSPAKGFPVILGHGIYDSSDTWIFTGPDTGLGYILSNNCYDAWAVNFRGNTYSRKHLRLDPEKDSAFWEFSFDENGNYDLPALIDYILNVTEKSSVYYVGHSQGSTDFFVMGSLRPDYNEKVRLSIQLAPVAWMKNIKSPIPKILSRRSKEIRSALEFAGYNEIFAKHQLTHLVPELLCQIAPNAVCGTVLALTTGYKLGSITSLNLAIGIGHLLVGVSVKTLTHFAQLVDSGQFRRYDEGKAGNTRKYGSTLPPKYDVSLITSPVVLISAKNDWLSTPEDLFILTSRLPNLVENYVVPEPTWSHNNHVWGVNATELVFEKILSFFQKFNT